MRPIVCALPVMLAIALAGPSWAFLFDPRPEGEPEPWPEVEGFTKREVREAMYFGYPYGDDISDYDDRDESEILEEYRETVEAYWEGPFYNRWQPFPALDLFWRQDAASSEQLFDFGIGYQHLAKIRAERILLLSTGIGAFYHEAGEAERSADSRGLVAEIGLHWRWSYMNSWRRFPIWRMGHLSQADVRLQIGVAQTPDPNDASRYAKGARIAITTHDNFVYFGVYGQAAWEHYPSHQVLELEGGFKLISFSFGWRSRRSQLGHRDHFVIGVRLTI